MEIEYEEKVKEELPVDKKQMEKNQLGREERKGNGRKLLK